MSLSTTAQSSLVYLIAIKKLRDLIEAERDAILTQNAQRLTDIAAEKSALLRQTEGLLSMLRQSGGPQGLGDQRQELTRLLEQCEQANRVNGTLLHSYAARAERVLSPLMATEGGGYGPRAGRPGGLRLISTLQARA